MKLNDVLAVVMADHSLWFRPVTWKGMGIAYCIRNDATHLVPSPSGGVRGMTCDPWELSGDWEVLKPVEVPGEQK